LISAWFAEGCEARPDRVGALREDVDVSERADVLLGIIDRGTERVPVARSAVTGLL
jgi:hypothetical protein